MGVGDFNAVAGLRVVAREGVGKDFIAILLQAEDVRCSCVHAAANHSVRAAAALHLANAVQGSVLLDPFQSASGGTHLEQGAVRPSLHEGAVIGCGVVEDEGASVVDVAHGGVEAGLELA